MIGPCTTPGTTRHKPAVLRKAVAVTAILVATGAVASAAAPARSGTPPEPASRTSEYIHPSKQVMREMRAVIIALYGPQPPAASQRSAPAHRSASG
jgi:hypothetical protein